MTVNKDRKVANYDPYKVSDRRILSADAKVIVALLEKHPQKRDDLWRSAGINKSTFYRLHRLLMNRGIIKETEKGYALWFHSEPTSLWNDLKHNFAQVGGNLGEIKIQKASYAGRDQETGWRVYNYGTHDFVKGIMVPRSAPRLVAAARSANIYIKNEYDGILLTTSLVGWEDRFWWNDKLYKIEEVEACDDGYNFSYNIAYLTELISDRKEEEAADTHAHSMTSDARNQTRTFLIAHLNNANILKDSDCKATYSVIYTNPPYPLINEFRASNSPVDGLYAIGEPESRALHSADQTIYAYKEHVPILIYTINKADVAGSKLKWAMEIELKRLCEAHRIGNSQRLERRGENYKRLGSIILYYTEFVLNYTHP